MSGIDHLGFIVAAYAVTVVALLATIVALLADLRTQRKLLKRYGPQQGGSA